MAQAMEKGGKTASQVENERAMEEPMSADRGAHAAMTGYMASLRADPLRDLTPTQRAYIENLQAVERANPKASPQDIAMAISVLLWEGRIWDADGKAASVTSPLGIPLVLDYEGGKGYEDVKLSPEQSTAFHKQRTLTDAQGRDSGVAHTFPAVASRAGREGSAAAAYNTRMVTSGGDMIQDVAQIIVEQKLEGTFRDAERRDNERAIEIAEAESSQPLSESLLQHFREENRSKADS